MPNYTKRQEKVLSEIKEENSKSYQILIYNAALELYEIIKDEPFERLELIIPELKELANNEMWNDALSKPKSKFDPVTKKVFKALNKQDCHSINSYSCTVRELSYIVEDYSGKKITPKGLKGALFTADEDGVSNVRDDSK